MERSKEKEKKRDKCRDREMHYLDIKEGSKRESERDRNYIR